MCVSRNTSHYWYNNSASHSVGHLTMLALAGRRRMMRLTAVLVAASALEARGFNLSNTLGDGVVLQRAPQPAIVWGFGAVGSSVTASLDGVPLPAVSTGTDSIWRIQLPPMPARSEPSTISFVSSDGGRASLRDVLFGDVFLCSGQSNMQYTPRSMAGMNNASAEIASADAFSSTIKIFTVGMDTSCGAPGSGRADCSQPFTQLNPDVPAPTNPCPGSRSCRKPWAAATNATVGGRAWDDFSAACFLFGRQMQQALGVPVGLISSNWGGTPLQAWAPVEALRHCGGASEGGTLYNSMIAPFTVGPMSLSGAIWYQVRARAHFSPHGMRRGWALVRSRSLPRASQPPPRSTAAQRLAPAPVAQGESNVGHARSYSCLFPAMIQWWRAWFAAPFLWFGFVQIAGYAYSRPVPAAGGAFVPDTARSRAAGDLRQVRVPGCRSAGAAFGGSAYPIGGEVRRARCVLSGCV